MEKIPYRDIGKAWFILVDWQLIVALCCDNDADLPRADQEGSPTGPKEEDD